MKTGLLDGKVLGHGERNMPWQRDRRMRLMKDGVLVRSAAQDQLAAILELMRAAFPDEDVHELVRQLTADGQFIPEYSLVAAEDGRIIGHVLLSRAYIDAEGEPLPVLCLAPLAVLPERQNEGIGTALVEAGLSRARKHGEKAVIVLGHPDYYPRFGFEPAMPLGILPPHPVEMSEAWMMVELEPGALDGISGTVRFDGPLGDAIWW